VMAASPGRTPGDRITGEQAALRRVATLVARAASPGEVFAAVAEEAGRVLDVDFTFLSRYEPDDSGTIVASWSGAGAAIPADTRVSLRGRNIHTLVFQTSRAARIQDYAAASGPAADLAREFGLRASVGVPISVEGRLWGVMFVAHTREEPLPAGTEARLAGFTELAGTAIANAQARLELREFAEEQAALRRVATLVSRAVPPEEALAAVTAEAGRLLHAHHASMLRYDPDDAMMVAAAWGNTFPVGTRLSLGGRNVTTLVFQTGRAARIEDYADASGPAAEGARELGLRGSIGVPISVEGRLWGVMFVAHTGDEPLPAGTEARLVGFTELAATAIANAQARLELREFAEEQAALRRVATLVAQAAPGEVFAAVTAEAGRLLNADITAMGRYDPDRAVTLVAVSGSTDAAPPALVDTRVSLGGRNVSTLVFETGRPARIDDWGDVAGSGGDRARELGIRSAVGVPVSVEGHLWGIMAVTSTREEPLPRGTEARLAGFTELVATAIANAEAQAALTASRARIVATADATRRRIERDLHDGTQQRLVSLALELRAAQAAVPPGTGELVQRLDGVAAGLTGVLEELREIARGLHPAVLADGGLRPALKALARRSAVPVNLHVRVERRLPEPVEIAAYYVVSEALTNTAKHAHATFVDVEVAVGDGGLHVRVRDDGRGGAHFGQGSGLVGLKDRAEALGGRIWLHSPPDTGTDLEITLPLHDLSGPGLSTASALPSTARPKADQTQASRRPVWAGWLALLTGWLAFAGWPVWTADRCSSAPWPGSGHWPGRPVPSRRGPRRSGSGRVAAVHTASRRWR
jgi:signal transduction histidine kinase